MSAAEHAVLVREGRCFCALHDEPLVRVTVPLQYGFPLLKPGELEWSNFLHEHAPHSAHRRLGGCMIIEGEMPHTAEVEHCAACVEIRDANPIGSFAPRPPLDGPAPLDE